MKLVAQFSARLTPVRGGQQIHCPQRAHSGKRRAERHTHRLAAAPGRKAHRNQKHHRSQGQPHHRMARSPWARALRW